MSKFNTFLAQHGTKIVIALLVLTYFKSCGIDSDVEKIKKDLRIEEISDKERISINALEEKED